jgi:hypothetical protein
VADKRVLDCAAAIRRHSPALEALAALLARLADRLPPPDEVSPNDNYPAWRVMITWGDRVCYARLYQDSNMGQVRITCRSPMALPPGTYDCAVGSDTNVVYAVRLACRATCSREQETTEVMGGVP